MSADENSLPRPYADRLTDFESRLRSTMDDRSLQQDVYRVIYSLLSDHQESETDIRKILLTRFEAGQLREETFQLVQGMLDRIVTEDLDTLSGGPGASPPAYADTDILPVTAGASIHPDRQLQVGSVLRDRFLLQRRVAGGSMGVVYRALDRRLAEGDGAQSWVAIKVLSPQLSRNAGALRALQQEAAKGRCLSHPNIVRVIDLDRDDDQYFIVMEWLDGRSLAAILDDPKTEKMDIGTALEVVRQVGNALDYAHRCGVVHADVKPGNIMVTPDGEVKLIDFGVARIQQKQRSGSEAERDAVALRAATPAYSSMQVLSGEDPVPADDVFSLGCLMYRLVAGYRVFGPRNAAEAAAAGMQPERLAGLTDGQWKALKKSLAYSRVARYTSPKAFIDDLDSARAPVTRQPISALDDEKVSTPSVRRQRNPWPTVLAAILLAAVAGLLFLRPERSDPDVAAALDYESGVAKNQAAPDTQPGIVATEPPSAEDLAVPLAASELAEIDRADGDAITEPTGVPSPGQAESGPQAEASDVAEPEAEPAAVYTGVPADDKIANVPAVSAELPFPVRESDRPERETEDGGRLAAVYQRPPAPLVRSLPRLPPATHEITIGSSAEAPPELVVRLREGGDAAIVDIFRTEGRGIPLVLRVSEDEVGTGRSARQSGEYEVSNDGMLEFAAGEDFARARISVIQDPLREPDRDVRLLVRDLAQPDEVYGVVYLTLEDDDQRAFESRLEPNTVAFAASQVSANEGDSAVQIDLIRYRPDAAPLDVRFAIEDITATEGLDYFAPGATTISFAPNQRSARLLIPLVQDTTNEADEAFLVELPETPVELEGDIFRRIAVMIRDDDP